MNDGFVTAVATRIGCSVEKVTLGSIQICQDSTMRDQSHKRPDPFGSFPRPDQAEQPIILTRRVSVELLVCLLQVEGSIWGKVPSNIISLFPRWGGAIATIFLITSSASQVSSYPTSQFPVSKRKSVRKLSSSILQLAWLACCTNGPNSRTQLWF